MSHSCVAHHDDERDIALCRCRIETCCCVPVPETSPCCCSFASTDARTCVTNALTRACFYGVYDYVLTCCVLRPPPCVHAQRKKTRPSGTSGNRRPSKGPAASSFFRRARRKAKRSCPYPSAHAGGADDDDDDDDDDDTVASGSDWDLNTLSPGCGSVGNASPASFSSSCSDSGAGLDVRLVGLYCCFLSVGRGSPHIQWPSRMPWHTNLLGFFQCRRPVPNNCARTETHSGRSNAIRSTAFRLLPLCVVPYRVMGSNVLSTFLVLSLRLPWVALRYQRVQVLRAMLRKTESSDMHDLNETNDSRCRHILNLTPDSRQGSPLLPHYDVERSDVGSSRESSPIQSMADRSEESPDRSEESPVVTRPMTNPAASSTTSPMASAALVSAFSHPEPQPKPQQKALPAFTPRRKASLTTSLH